MKFNGGEYDVIVVGAGHAGCEAALASARMGCKTLVITMSLDSIALMPCNPSIGGTGKGHLVREIDALGGEMGINIDKTFIQSRMLNTAKGPAVHSLRAQADKYKYHKEMKKTLENQENLDLVMDEVIDIISEENIVKGVSTKLGANYYCKALILSTGVYLNSKIYIGEVSFYEGPNALGYSKYLTDSLVKLGLRMRRFKTGTPARIHRDSIDFSKMEIQMGDEKIIPFSFINDELELRQEPCYLTRTTENTHKIIMDNIKRSAMYSGEIESVGPRYCPSIEDKVVRFNDKPSHQTFIEPEGLGTKEMYIQGISTSLPYEVQIDMYKSITGLENCKIMRPAYAIEYDCIDPTQLKPSLEIKGVENLFSAGQFNGTSGYEEAAAQGLIAGINAVLKIQGKDSFILDRSEAYIGVLIDDLVTKGTNEPYRMMTSRSEYRLLLRQDNADLRLTEKGYEIGLVTEERYKKFKIKKEQLDKEIERLKTERVTPKQVNKILDDLNLPKINTGMSLYEFFKRPEYDYKILEKIGKDPKTQILESVKEQCQITAKYEGYIDKQLKQIDQFKKLETKKLPQDIDYSKIDGLRLEARQKLNDIRPISIGQASRISGVSPADISVLLIYLEQIKRGRGERIEQ
ncbi:tRNA uridine-5-carboxymethylaminomethyl(34) synthesis enzyme MnmG [Tepidibacter formicigenes]|jgi:tRNA uridine 5-carboxymethylaminomethyl modification enzyme|uniref:tRNA uridine 5-carboxymethylaminomethyl modification enzyme MnmG n=1 Tax=Tepidibacter formicigenes DSM 15518 TaxID=1123349 RepID=A0A1M6P8L6_9FIRM|nr:tRNA uridine-5-carboxymethylaminomethyl(34) synthesis enzyme MnmG [Tepidibacter formicigenes]SHK04285.1 tRNA uridine 5-carboxymethylaminomethyl modification enzyme [Tepidibacter formicigenes DSM 15518]